MGCPSRLHRPGLGNTSQSFWLRELHDRIRNNFFCCPNVISRDKIGRLSHPVLQCICSATAWKTLRFNFGVDVMVTNLPPVHGNQPTGSRIRRTTSSNSLGAILKEPMNTNRGRSAAEATSGARCVIYVHAARTISFSDQVFNLTPFGSAKHSQTGHAFDLLLVMLLRPSCLV